MKIYQHLSVMVIITIVMALIYASVQQTYRSNANDPQVQLAHDLRDRLQKGESLAFDDTVDLGSSLSIFKETYDRDGSPLQSTAFINGRIPRLPKGVFEYARANGEHWVTWQPQSGVRMATGIVRVDAAPVAYLAVGRSLKEVEERISNLTKMVFIGWILCIAVVLINWLVTYYHYQRKLVKL